MALLLGGGCDARDRLSIWTCDRDRVADGENLWTPRDRERRLDDQPSRAIGRSGAAMDLVQKLDRRLDAGARHHGCTCGAVRSKPYLSALWRERGCCPLTLSLSREGRGTG